MAAHLDLKVHRGDAKDAFAHSPDPEMNACPAIDDAHAKWCEIQFDFMRLMPPFEVPLLSVEPLMPFWILPRLHLVFPDRPCPSFEIHPAPDGT